MTKIARTIQDGERAAGDADFYGYLWQGKDEGIVVNALEWIFSYGGGTIIEPVSQYSKHPDVAADLVKYFSSVEVEKTVALELCGMPSRPALYQDKDILSKFPWFENLPAIFGQAVARPSNVLGENYNRLAYLLSDRADRFLRHDGTAEETVRQIEDGAKKLMRGGE